MYRASTLPRQRLPRQTGTSARRFVTFISSEDGLSCLRRGKSLSQRTKDVIVYYKQSAMFEAAIERALSWRDPSVGIELALDGEPILSAKDASVVRKRAFGAGRPGRARDRAGHLEALILIG